MNKPVIIVGASGHGKVVADIVIKSHDILVGFLDDNENLKEFAGYPVLGRTSDYIKHTDCFMIIAIGKSDIREKFATEMEGKVIWYTGIHPSAQISTLNVKIGSGSVIMANAVVNSNSSIGQHCIVNTSAIVEHDNTIADFVHISVGVRLGGNVCVGKSTWIGIGSTVNNNINICDNCMIGAGAVVIDDITESNTYVGIPAKILNKHYSNSCL